MEASEAPSMPWENWLRLYRFFLTGSGLNTASDEMRLAVLYGSLGSEAARIASNLTDDNTSYDETLKRLGERFGESQSVIFARTRFHRRGQQAGEDVLAYVTELRRLASHCKFGLVENENVRDRLVAGCQDDKIRERLFLEPEDLTLENATLLAQNVERATSESTRLDPKHVSASQHGPSLQRIASRHSRLPSRRRHRSSSQKSDRTFTIF